jgi:hypothetical protein
MTKSDAANDSKHDLKSRPFQDPFEDAERSHADLKRVQAEGEAIASLARVMAHATQEEDEIPGPRK